MLYKGFAERFKKLRLERQLSQLELSKILNISRSNISKYENGVQLPEYEMLTSICNYFGVTKSYMLGEYISIGELLDEKLESSDLIDVKNLSDEEKEALADKLLDLIKIMKK